MKRIIYLSLFLPLFFFSCESNHDQLPPEAQFSSELIEPEVGQEVFFTNESHNAVRFEWDFGDGYISTDGNPSHVYTGTGTFEVILTAFSKNGSSGKASLLINVMIPTLLEIEVLEWDTKLIISDASVILYPTITDWDAQTNETSEGYTDADGLIVFSNLDPFVYYVDVWEATHDNYTLRDEDVGFIRTPEILPHKINRFRAWVDVVDHGKGTGRGARKVIIKKFERKAADVRQPAAGSGSQDWKELYNRRSGKR